MSQPEANVELLAKMTERERQVCLGVARGKSNRDISNELHLQEQSIKNLVSSALRKAKADNRVQLALMVHGIDFQN